EPPSRTVTPGTSQSRDAVAASDHGRVFGLRHAVHSAYEGHEIIDLGTRQSILEGRHLERSAIALPAPSLALGFGMRHAVPDPLPDILRIMAEHHEISFPRRDMLIGPSGVRGPTNAFRTVTSVTSGAFGQAPSPLG